MDQFQGMISASLCSLAGRYDNSIPTRFLAPIDGLKIPDLYSTVYGISRPNTEKPGTEYGCRDMITNHSFDLLRINTDQSRGSTLYKELSFHIIKCKLI